ncbi:MAG: hypothetical protein ACAH27_08010 [Xanthobacteraceae bacterium]
MVATAPALADVPLGALGENEDVQTAADWLREGEHQFGAIGSAAGAAGRTAIEIAADRLRAGWSQLEPSENGSAAGRTGG